MKNDKINHIQTSEDDLKFKYETTMTKLSYFHIDIKTDHPI